MSTFAPGRYSSIFLFSKHPIGFGLFDRDQHTHVIYNRINPSFPIYSCFTAPHYTSQSHRGDPQKRHRGGGGVGLWL